MCPNNSGRHLRLRNTTRSCANSMDDYCHCQEQWQEAETGNGEEPPEELRVSEVRMRKKGKPSKRRDSILPEGVDVQMEEHPVERMKMKS